MARIYERITAALLWIAAFCFASGVFFSITLLFRSLPPTPPVAIGVVTIERYSKLKDYLGAAIFFLAVPPLTNAQTTTAKAATPAPNAIQVPRLRALGLWLWNWTASNCVAGCRACLRKVSQMTRQATSVLAEAPSTRLVAVA